MNEINDEVMQEDQQMMMESIREQPLQAHEIESYVQKNKQKVGVSWRNWKIMIIFSYSHAESADSCFQQKKLYWDTLRRTREKTLTRTNATTADR